MARTKNLADKTMEELIEIAANYNIEGCSYCRYKGDCSGHITSGGNGEPCYPPCSDGDYERCFDEDAIIERIEECEDDE